MEASVRAYVVLDVAVAVTSTISTSLLMMCRVTDVEDAAEELTAEAGRFIPAAAAAAAITLPGARAPTGECNGARGDACGDRSPSSLVR